MMILFPNRSKVGDNMFYLFFSRTLLSCCLSYCSQATNFQNRRRCSVSAVTFHCSWTCSQAQKRRGPGKSSFSGLANISCMHWTFKSHSFVGGKWKILWNLMEFLLFSCLQTTPKSLTAIKNTKPYMGNQWKSNAKHYPRIHPAGKAFRQPPFCMSMAISSDATPYINITVVTIIYNLLFNIQNKKQRDIKVKSADVILLSFNFFP